MFFQPKSAPLATFSQYLKALPSPPSTLGSNVTRSDLLRVQAAHPPPSFRKARPPSLLDLPPHNPLRNESLFCFLPVSPTRKEAPGEQGFLSAGQSQVSPQHLEWGQAHSRTLGRHSTEICCMNGIPPDGVWFCLLFLKLFNSNNLFYIFILFQFIEVSAQILILAMNRTGKPPSLNRDVRASNTDFVFSCQCSF